MVDKTQFTYQWPTTQFGLWRDTQWIQRGRLAETQSTLDLCLNDPKKKVVSQIIGNCDHQAEKPSISSCLGSIRRLVNTKPPHDHPFGLIWEQHRNSWDVAVQGVDTPNPLESGGAKLAKVMLRYLWLVANDGRSILINYQVCHK